jgi:glucan phosphoethanolaminetransferase (alkaline phosphatase superfamily)
MWVKALPRIRLLVVTLWAGSLWTVGYLVAPVLFATVPDRSLAGSIAGSLFRAQAWLSLACGLVLLLLVWLDKTPEIKRTANVLIIAMLVCVLVGYFGLQPFMAEIRAIAASNGGAMDETLRFRFGIFHGLATLIYFLQSVLAMMLVIKVRI